MTRRLSVLAIVIFLALAVVIVQAANIQFLRANALDTSPINPRVSQASTTAPRGKIIAADGTVLAQSVPVGGSQSIYRRVYPLGALTAGIVGFYSPSYGTWALEAQYNSYLTAHAQPPHSFVQLLAPSSATNDVTLTLE